MVIVECYLVEIYNCDLFNVVDYYIYSICGDGDLMEGIFFEVVLFVGYFQFGCLIVLYDFNDIFFDGDFDCLFFENVKQCFEVMNWEVFYVEDGNNIEELIVVIEKVC